ncbi:hypothetical protein LINPERHAP1_LOCUS17799 [Linum perenne]
MNPLLSESLMTIQQFSEVKGSVHFWQIRNSSITHSLEPRLTNRQDLWNRDDETDVLGQDSESAIRLS